MSKFDVDFAHVRKHGDIVAVVKHYGVTLEGDGVQRKGLCPFHEDKRPSLNVNVEKRVFHCFACTAKGNVIDFVQQIDPALKNPRLAAKQVAELSHIATNTSGNGSHSTAHSTAPTQQPAVKERAPRTDPVVVEPAAEPVVAEETSDPGDGVLVNRPLTFTLKLEPVVPGASTPATSFVETVGLSYDRLTDLGIGMSGRGTMKDRLAIPIFNKDHELVAYCGRHVGPPLGEQDPKYKFPANFRKEFELYGWDVAQNFERVVLVESFLSVIKHGGEAAAAGFGVASVMGSSISDRQVALLLETRPQVVVCFDGDEAGGLGSMQVATMLTQAGLWTVVRNCQGGRKPHHDDSEDFCGRCGVD